MKCCSSFRHMLSITATVAVTCFVLQSQAAPACHSLLLPSLSNAQINSVISEIASLRLELDLTLSAGSTSSVSKSLEPIFENKLEELYDRLQGQKSRVEIQKMIRDRITKLQEKQEEVIEEVNKEREAQKPEFPKQRDSKVLPKAFRSMNYFGDYNYYSKMVYLQKTESFIYGSDLRRHFINENRSEAISSGVYSFKVEPDEKSLYFLSKYKQLVHYDIENQKLGPKISLQSSKELRWDFNRPDFSLSPDKKTVTLFMNNTFEVFDAITGKRIASSLEIGQEITGHISNLEYVSNTEVIGNTKKGFFRFNIPTKEFEILPVELTQPHWDWLLTTDRNNIVTRSLNNIGHIPLQGPGKFVATNNTVLENGLALILPVGIRTEPAFLFFSQKWNKNDYAGIYNAEGGIKRITHFEDLYELSDHNEIVVNAAIAGDGSSLLVLVLDKRTDEVRADFLDLKEFVGSL